MCITMHPSMATMATMMVAILASTMVAEAATTMATLPTIIHTTQTAMAATTMGEAIPLSIPSTTSMAKSQRTMLQLEAQFWVLEKNLLRLTWCAWHNHSPRLSAGKTYFCWCRHWMILNESTGLHRLCDHKGPELVFGGEWTHESHV